MLKTCFDLKPNLAKKDRTDAVFLNLKYDWYKIGINSLDNERQLTRNLR